MARSSSVSFEAVEQICFQLLSQGENPSFNLVYAELGNKGSSEIVQRYIDQWRRETGEAFFRQRSIPGMPDELVSAADVFMGKVWSLSLQHADQIFATQRQDLEQEREAFRAQLRQAQDRILQLEVEAGAASQQVKSFEQAVLSRDSTIADLRSQALEFLRQREGLENRLKQLEDAAEVREQKFAAESERLTRLLQTDRDRYGASLKEEQDRSAQEREMLLKQVDLARQEKLSSNSVILVSIVSSSRQRNKLSSRATAARTRTLPGWVSSSRIARSVW